MTDNDPAMAGSMASDQLEEMAADHLREGRYGHAAALYRELVARHPGDDSFVLALAWACHDDGRIEEAIGCFEGLFRKELSRKVFTGFAFDELVRIFKRQGRYDRLLLVCEQAAAAQPRDFALMGDLGEAYLKTGQADRAAAVFRQMTEMEPDDAVLFCNLGNALIALSDFAGADRAYEKAVTIEPDQGASYYGRLADQYRKAGQRERAEEAIRKSLAREAREPAYHLLLGDLLFADGKANEGWQAYEAAVNLRPSSAGAYYNRLGNSLAEASDHEGAVTAFRKAISVEPKNPFFFLRLAESYAALGQEDLAREAIKLAESMT